MRTGRFRARATCAVGLACLLFTTGLDAGQRGGGEPSPARGASPAAPDDPFKFKSEAGILIWTVKADQTEAFESVWTVLLERLVASTKPDLKAAGEHLKIFKADTPGNTQEATYFMVASPASKTVSYEVAPFLLFESGLFQRAEADELFKLLSSTIVRINAFPVNAVK